MSTFKCALVLCVSIASLFPEAAALAQTRAHVPVPPQALTPTAHPAPSTGTLSRAGSFISTLTFAGLGFPDGVRFANLGGRREIFVPLPPGLAITPAELVLTLDDASAHDARRSLEILVNDRTASAIPLDGH